MTTRREIKQEAVARVRAEREARRARKTELAAMPGEDRRAAKAADRAEATQAAKLARRERKMASAEMTRAERRLDKRRERVYRKVKHRPRRAIGWGIAGVAVVGLGVLVVPTVGDIARLTSLKIDSSTPEGIAAREHSIELAGRISDEGIVLLENGGGVLPLAAPAVNVFSFASFNLRYGGGGSGGADQSSAVTLYDALEQQGFEVNPELYATMQQAGAKTAGGPSNGLVQIASMLVSGGEQEPAPDYLTDEVLAQARGFSDVALVVIGNDGTEAQDFTPEQLRLTAEQRELLDLITGSFEDVIVIVNSGNQMELGFLEEYPEITGAVWIGTPGPQGAVSLARVLDGSVNPSGRLTDTYAYDVSSAPSVVNFGDFKYDNVDRGFTNYDESIYIGYRYYETRYEGDEAGYQAAVQYPFGYGLGYTSFDWRAAGSLSEAATAGDGTVTVAIDVTNTGEVAGKDVVELYATLPHTPGGIEKSSVVLAGFAKTSLLAPGQSERVEISFDKRDLASWDLAGGGYVLEAGEYGLFAGSDVHTRRISGAFTEPQDVVYDTDGTTGETLENRFEYAAVGVQPLSRDDWEGSWPDLADTDFTAPAEVLERMNPVVTPAAGDAPVTGADHGLVLADLEGLDYDDPKWQLFLDQLTLDEQLAIFSKGAYKTEAVERLGIPSAILLDGPAGLNSLFSRVTAASFPTEVVVASTWNAALAREMGESVGAEANAYGVHGWYAPAMNLHRTPLGGRNFEYFSEDPLISGEMSAALIAGAQGRQVLTFMKHFALNDQETNARSGVNVFVDEQAMRELYLRPFEISVKEGGASGAMSSFINIGGSWSGGNEQLLQEVLRGEWGFEGIVSTDAVLGGFMDPVLAVRHGNDLMLAILPSATMSTMRDAYAADPAGIGQGLRARVHAVAYALLGTDLV